MQLVTIKRSLINSMKATRSASGQTLTIGTTPTQSRFTHVNYGLLGCVPIKEHGKVSGKTMGNVHLFPYNKSPLTGVKIIDLH